MNREPTIRRSKAVGEPPFMLGVSVLEALSMAVASVADYRVCPRLDAPATPERVLMAIERLPGARTMTVRPEAIDRFRGDQGAAALVRVETARGSTPREAGAWMLVGPQATLGTIGGGQLEYMAIDAARAMLARGGDRQTPRRAARPRDRPVLRRAHPAFGRPPRRAPAGSALRAPRRGASAGAARGA